MTRAKRDNGVRAAEAGLQWDPLPEAPRLLRRLVARAGRDLAVYVVKKDPAALLDLARVLDRVVAHPAFADADREFRLSLLNRDGIAHNWLGVDAKGDGRAHFDASIVLLQRGITEAAGGASPTLWRLHANLSNSLLNRYHHRAGHPVDLEAAVQAARTSIEVVPRGQAPFLAQSMLSAALQVRHRRDGNRADLEEAIELARAAVAGSPDGLRRYYFRFVLSQVLQYSYDVTGSLADLDEAERLLRECLVAPSLPVQLEPRSRVEGTLATVLRRRFVRTRAKADIDETIDLLLRDADTADPARLTNLGNALLDRFELVGDVQDLGDAVNAQLAAVDATSPGDWQAASRHNNAGNALLAAAEYTGDDALARRAADSYRASLAMTGADEPERASREYNLARALQDLCQGEQSGPLVDEAKVAYGEAVRVGLNGSLEWGLAAARAWGRWAAQREAWSEAADAYGSAIDFAQRLFRVQLARPQQEAWLAESQGVPGEAAYAMARADRPRDAVEALERGRTLLLSESLARDRADLAQLEATHPTLAGAYRDAALAVDAALRTATAGSEALRVVRARLDDVVTEIRAIPGHEGFLAAPAFEDVSRAVKAVGLLPGGVLAYVAAAPTGGVALLVEGSSAGGCSVRAVELPRCTVEACRRRAAALLAARASDDPSAGVFAGTLDAVTRWLWEAVMEPVLEAAASPGRMVLVPSGLLTLLPLHAAWMSEGDSRRYVVDQVVLSYAPGARALQASAMVAASAADVRRTVVVANPEPTRLPPIGFASSEAAWTATGPSDVVLSGEASTKEAVLREVVHADVVHFACHGASRSDDPLASGLTLSGDEQLTLADLLQVRLRGSGSDRLGARLVVLSACDTDQPGIALPDEVVSLPTGLLQAGAAGVLGTQWAVRSLAAGLLVSAFQAEWRLEGKDPPEALAGAQRWLRKTTNKQKVADLQLWSQGLKALGAAGADDRRGLARALKLRDPEAKDFAEPAHWAAASFHGV